VLHSAEGYFPQLVGELFEMQLPGDFSLLSVIGGADTAYCFSRVLFMMAAPVKISMLMGGD